MDRDPLSFAGTMAGEHAMTADKLRREASELRRQAETLEGQAVWHDERREWANALAEAFQAHAMSGTEGPDA